MSTPRAQSGRPAAPGQSDDAYLRQLGYKPQLTRRMGSHGNFAISFSVISVLSGCMTLYGFGLATGGPAVMLWGWVVVGALLLIVIGAQLFCGNAEVAACSRMVFAFSRDGALPGCRIWRRVDGRTGTPVAAVWLSVVIAGLFAVPSLYSPTAYGAVTAINVVGITPAYAIPVHLRLRNRRSFVPGPWNLGSRGPLVGWIAVVRVAFVTVLFLLPQSYPVTAQTFNYAPVALAAVLLLATIWWYVAGRHSYETPTYASARESASLEEETV
ncbi:amino acid permease [Streptomyces sp. NPDC049577]|uniref:amino acid permease n=1 Tax=Streptomyces sp. NPDC049577 TaxID=3155153 RepID=UPI00342FF49D